MRLPIFGRNFMIFLCWLKNVNILQFLWRNLKIHCSGRKKHTQNVNTILYISLGVRSIEHCNVLGEKINFSVHSARRIAIFWRDDLYPLNINANLFWTPLTPPICLKMTKCAIFSTFWESHFKNTPKVGVHSENFNIGNLSQIFFGAFNTC